MLAAVTRRAQQEGLGSRISTREVELPAGLEDLGSADVIWMSLALHHVGDEVGLLHALRDNLAPGGVLAIAELGDPLRVWQADVEISGAERAVRIERARAAWFARMRAGLAGSVPSEDLAVMVRAAGLEVAGDRLVRLDLAAPLPEPTRRAALGHLRQIAAQLRDDLDEEDRAALERLGDDEHAGVLHRPDVWLQASRRIVIARAGGER
jgi:SAM-dependent methyltransferase